MATNFAFQSKNNPLSPNKATKSGVDTNQVSSLNKQASPTPGIETAKDQLYVILQTSLDLKEILAIFENQIKNHIAFDSCHYRNRSLDLQYDTGKRSRHCCTYRLLTRDDYLGELVFSRKNRFTEGETKSLETLICTVIYPIKNALRYREAVQSALTDALTGAGNRVSLNNSLAREFELARRYRQPLSLLMIDLDRFKSINDKFGHSAGDKVLKTVVKEIQNTSRCADMTFRYGGEEFVVLLNKTNKEGAKVIAERLRAAIAGLSCIHDNIEIPITTSIGCVTLCNEDNTDDLLKKADSALYNAKSSGRNRVCIAED